jgi:hypothetical protein
VASRLFGQEELSNQGDLAPWFRPVSLVVLCIVLLATGVVGLSGCGEKIAVPQPRGLFSVSAYYLDEEFTDLEPRQVAVIKNNLFVLTSGDGRLTKRDQKYGEIASAGDFGDPTAFCGDDQGEIIFVWDQASRTVSYYNAEDLAFIGSTNLDTDERRVKKCVGMTACDTGIDIEPGAQTFLYLADPDSGVVHRYVYDEFSGLRPFGLLARSDGEAARFVHDPAGMATDLEGMVLVCDADTSRNWVIRFDPTPDLEDSTPDPHDQDPWRGKATLFAEATCEPPAASDFTLGDAADCGESGWVGGPSSAEGEFFRPLAVSIDGSGRIYVVDSGNHRVQIFTPDGYYEMLFGSEEMTPSANSLGIVDVRTGSGEEDVNYGAYVFVVVPELQSVRKFISAEEYIRINQEPPPEPG